MAASFGNQRWLAMFSVIVIGSAFRRKHSVEHEGRYSFERYKAFASRPLHDYAVACSHNSFVTRSSEPIDAFVKDSWNKIPLMDHYHYLCDNATDVSCQVTKLFEAGYRVIELDVHAYYKPSSNVAHLFVNHAPKEIPGKVVLTLTSPNDLQPLLKTIRAALEKDETKFGNHLRPPLYMNIESRFFDLTETQETTAYTSLARTFLNVFGKRLYTIENHKVPTLFDVSAEKRRVIVMEGNKDLDINSPQLEAWRKILSFFPKDDPDSADSNVTNFSGVWYKNIGEDFLTYAEKKVSDTVSDTVSSVMTPPIPGAEGVVQEASDRFVKPWASKIPNPFEFTIPDQANSRYITRLYPNMFRFDTNAPWQRYLTRGYNFVCMNAALRDPVVEAYECWFSTLTKFASGENKKRFGFDGFVRRDLFKTCMSHYDGTLRSERTECQLSGPDYDDVDIAAMKDVWHCAAQKHRASTATDNRNEEVAKSSCCNRGVAVDT
eukprot:TRINITY_DN5186_c0_g1_i1.p1 TRINITY_DN5186_c0_g1~~TRINITY_DN5186_c0_g1_i1.p1  ORF type:complete len:491 (+),score=33.43 TRINITY_DN5186_c0_g1_i1:53-1525(+)